MKIRDEVTEWGKYCHRNYTPKTCHGYRQIMKQFLEYLSRDGEVLTTAAIEDYVDDILQRACECTANGHINCIKSFCRWRSERYKVENLAKPIRKLKVTPTDQRILSDTEYQKILVIAKGRDRDIIQFAANTGLRRNELRDLKWLNVSPDYFHLKVFGKGRKERIIPLNPICQGILRRYERLDSNSFIQFSHKYTGIESWYFCCKKLSRDCSIPRFGCHSLRHYFATRLMRKGVSLFKISKLLGHSSVEITQKIYIHFVYQDLDGSTDCLTD